MHKKVLLACKSQIGWNWWKLKYTGFLCVVSHSCCAHEKLCFYSLFRNILLTNSISTLQNNLLPSGETTANGNSVVIQDVSRHHSGIYICTADNQVGSPAKAEIDLKVLCKFLFFHPSIKKITRKRQTTTFKKDLLTTLNVFQCQIQTRSHKKFVIKFSSMFFLHFRPAWNWSRSVLDFNRRRHRGRSVM